jgi:two-component system, NtrC family, sensor histidine kinase HydH
MNVITEKWNLGGFSDRWKRLLTRLRRAPLRVLIPVGLGTLFTLALVITAMWAHCQALLDEPWNSRGWLLVSLIPLWVLVIWIVERGARHLMLDPLDEIRLLALRVADGKVAADALGSEQLGEEVRALAAAFDVMSASLREGYELLEQRVAERTARLDTLNAELWAEVEGRRRIEHSLRNSELRYRGLFDHSLGGIALLRLVRDQAGRPMDFVFTDLNPAAETLTGLHAASTAGRSVGEFLPKINKPFRETVGRVALGGKPVEMEMYVPQLRRYLAISIFALPTDQVAVQFEDITAVKVAQRKLSAYSEQLEAMVEARTRDLERAQEQLVRREKLAFLGQMAGSVGHELRNPLAVIGNAATLLSYTLHDADPMVQDYINQISSQVERSSKIIRDLLNLARTGQAFRIPTPPRALLGQVLAQAAVPAAVVVHTDVPEMLPPLLIDPQQIELVLNNLVLNACEAMPNGGRLTVSARQEGARVGLAIADTGYGISPENMTKLFEPLFTTKPRGIGLGLAVCHNLTQLNLGDIKVASEVGQGTTVTVWLPIAAPES